MRRTKLFLSSDGKVVADQMITLRKSEVDALIDRANQMEKLLRDVLDWSVPAPSYWRAEEQRGYEKCVKQARAATGGTT
jgi:hypothetical protein